MSAVNQQIKPELVKGATVIVVDGGRPEGTFFDLDVELLGKIGTITNIDRLYTVYQPEAYVKFDDGSEACIELPNLEVTERPAVKATTVIASRQPRVKYLYIVEDNGVPVYTTFDREDAREEKAFLGGKAEGVIITAYAPVKEIR